MNAKTCGANSKDYNNVSLRSVYDTRIWTRIMRFNIAFIPRAYEFIAISYSKSFVFFLCRPHINGLSLPFAAVRKCCSRSTRRAPVSQNKHALAFSSVVVIMLLFLLLYYIIRIHPFRYVARAYSIILVNQIIRHAQTRFPLFDSCSVPKFLCEVVIVYTHTHARILYFIFLTFSDKLH